MILSHLNRHSALIVAAVATLFGGVSASPAQFLVTLDPVEDAWEAPTQPAPTGALPNLRVSAPAARRTFIQFDLSVLPPGATVTSAELRLMQGGLMNPGVIEAREVLGAWDEDTLVNPNAPMVSTSAEDTVSVGTASDMDYLGWDITALAQKWAMSPLLNNGVALVAGDQMVNVAFAALESPSSGPQLVIGYSVPLDANTFAGQPPGFYLDRSNHTGTQPPASIFPQGSGSGLDADFLDGLDSSSLRAQPRGVWLEDPRTSAPCHNFCAGPNPQTGSCSCPAGTTEVRFPLQIDAGDCGIQTGVVGVCVGP